MQAGSNNPGRVRVGSAQRPHDIGCGVIFGGNTIGNIDDLRSAPASFGQRIHVRRRRRSKSGEIVKKLDEIGRRGPLPPVYRLCGVPDGGVRTAVLLNGWVMGW